MYRRLGATGLAVAGMVLVSVAPAGARTEVAVGRGDVVKITVRVDCVGCRDWPAPDGGDLARYWEQRAERAWRQAFDQWSYCNKYKLELDIIIKTRPADFAGRPGWHRILAGAPGGGLAQTGWDGVFETTPGGDPGQRSPDGTRYFQNDADGAMAADATETVIVHEFGHVLGLGDDRDDAGNVVPGRDGTTMVGGARGVTPNTKLRIDKSLVQRIGDQIANLGEITCGQTWKGTIKGEGANVSGPASVACPDPSNHRGEFTMLVKPDGAATLTGHMVNTGVCAAGRTEAGFALAGKKTRAVIRFPAVATFPFPVELRVSGDRASGSTTERFGDGGVYVVTLDLRARCQDCGEAVG